ncbi:MAG: type I-C CRISPR-associated protein Cas8c/Csd1 [Methylococcales bacterium]|nr:type I-C CRISPR-associated protein Cas8c/Csd1 [Methylococcaceae bacterium]
MSWMEKLYQTYEQGIGLDTSKPWPISHFVKTAHIEVVIDDNGNIKKDRITLLSGEDSLTLIPATEASAGRAGAKIAPHPLCDELGYCASDFPEAIQARNDAYLNQLKEWCLSEYAHPKILAISKYLEKRSLWSDLNQAIVFPITFSNRSGQKTKINAEKAFVRWKVEEPGNPCSGTWEDNDLIEKWVEFDKLKNSKSGLCFITGEEVRLIENHSRFIRNASDGAKLISSNDGGGYTYRGKFLENSEACSIGFDVSQKAHNALRWLIFRQGFKSGDKEPQVFVSWAVSGKAIPEPLRDTWALFDSDEYDLDEVDEDLELEQHVQDYTHDLGQSFALKLKKYMAGYAAKLSPNEQIVIMGIDSATPGRMGIIYYRELFSHDFLNCIETWHSHFAWQQNYGWDSKAGKKIEFVGVPSPKDISAVAYGHRDEKGTLQLDDKLQKATVARLLPCIVDGLPIPRDLVESTFRRACNRIGMKKRSYNGRSFEDDWEKTLGIACALYKGYHQRHPNLTQRREYAMALEENYPARDYLFGRLLAIAERIEDVALSVSGENRPTTAARLMQRFADRPFETWRTIELALQPYMQRLRVSRAGFLTNQLKELDAIQAMFKHEDFTSKAALSGEFLLGYHCQRQKFKTKSETTDETSQGDSE